MPSAARLFALAVAWPAASAAWVGAGPQRRDRSSAMGTRARRNIGQTASAFTGRRRSAMSLGATLSSAEASAAVATPPALDTRNIGATPKRPNRPPRRTLHLLSLPPKDDAYSLPAEALVRECWRWKDAALGDGRDYFVPRPRALRAFQSLFVGLEVGGSLDGRVVLTLPSSDDEAKLHLATGDVPQTSVNSPPETTFVVEECAALSNCARLDVIMVLRSTDQSGSASQYTMETAETAARYTVAYNLQQQVASYRSKDRSLLQRTGLASWLDSTDGIALTPTAISPNDEECREIDNLATRLASLEGARPISTHLSLIAGGLATRPNRPDREVIFRPYSSRDAHVLLQLKRTVEVISVLDATDDEESGGGRGRIKTLLDGALRAGKAARNENVVPEIVQLKEYGSDGTPPAALASKVAEAAIKHAIEPSVRSCVAKLAAMEADTAQRISELRRRVDAIVESLEDGTCYEIDTKTNSAELRKMANKLLHAPTMGLRDGTLSGDDVDGVVRSIERELVDRLGRKTLQR